MVDVGSRGPCDDQVTGCRVEVTMAVRRGAGLRRGVCRRHLLEDPIG